MTFDTDDLRGIGPPVPADAGGVRVDLFLARRFPFYSRAQWATLCRSGELLVNGGPARPSYRLKPGDRVARFHPLTAEPDVDRGVYLLGEAPGVIALYKPGNLPMHESGDFRRNTFLAIVAETYGQEWFPLHRLDRETSGVVVCGATHHVRSAICRAFREHEVEKSYELIVHGAVPWDEKIVDQDMTLHETGRKPRYYIGDDAAGGLPSRTDFTVLQRASGATHLRARPRTGRTNQIRVHAASTGHPIIGDKMYSVSSAADRHALHAAHVAFRHPDTGKAIAFAAPLPEDLLQLWSRFPPLS